MPLLLFSLLLHGWIAWRVLPALPEAGALAFGAWLVASALILPLGLAARRYRRGTSADRLAWLVYGFLGVFSSLLMLTLLRDLALLGGAAFAALLPGHLDLASLAAWSAAGVPLGGLAISAVGLVNARRTAAVVSVDIPIEGLPAALHGFTIAQISDVHVGPTIKGPYLEAIVDAVNRLRADMVAVTGDLVDGSVAQLAGHVAPLAGLASRHGTFFVTGNHEYYSGAAGWIAELQRLGLKVLLNEHVVLREGDAVLVVAGVTDWSAHLFSESHRSDPAVALQGAPAGAVKLLLAHQPRTAPAAAAAGYHLQLSGHTHGGQFLPWNFLVRLQQPFTAGLHRFRALWVYVSRGTGYWGPPKRLGAPSEITLLRLIAA